MRKAENAADFRARKEAVMEKYAAWLSLWEQGLNGFEIAEKLGLVRREVNDKIYRLRVAYGLFPQESRTMAKYKQWRQIWERGGSVSEIAREAGFSVCFVSNYIGKFRKEFGWFPFFENDPRALTHRPRTEDEAIARYQEWIDLWALGKSIRQVSDAVGESYPSVSGTMAFLRQQFGLFPHRVKEAPEVKFKRWIELWEANASIPEMAKQLGLRVNKIATTVLRMRKLHGLFPARVKRNAMPKPPTKPRVKGKSRGPALGRTTDYGLKWLIKLHGAALADWQKLAAAYMTWADRNRKSLPVRLASIGRFLDAYVPKHRFTDPKSLLQGRKRESLPPLLGLKDEALFNDFEERGRDAYNFVSDFLDWVLANDDRFSEDDGDGNREPLPGCQNPLGRVSKGGLTAPSSSVRAPLPYKYIVELRDMLAPGRNFSDWKWAQTVNSNRSVARAGWFEVPKELVDRSLNDPDFVWERREVHETVPYKPSPGTSSYGLRNRRRSGSTREAYYAWSPVAAVALLIKLYLPLRQFQVRMLDDGSMDFERCDLVEGTAPDGAYSFEIQWQHNENREALIGNLKANDRVRINGTQGVFRKVNETITQEVTTGLFINTNKTADVDKDWHKRGYVIHWEHREVLRWLIKLRNWQEKYNPLPSPSLWSEMKSKHHGQRQGAHYFTLAPPACFLFRDASAKNDPADRTFPILDGSLMKIWEALLYRFEEHLWTDGVRTHAGGRVEMIKTRRKHSAATHFPLHSLRVSLLTSLAFEGGVSLRTLMGLAGHSRILMAIYYQKLGSVMTSQELEEGFQRALALGEKRIEAFLMQKTLDQVAQLVVSVDQQSLTDALPPDPAERTPAGWLKVGGGFCLMGGNTAANPENRGIGGCFNGGPVIAGKIVAPIHGPVAPRNCIGGKCRWFVTRPEFLPELHARARNLFYHLTDAQQRAEAYDAQLKALRVEKLQAQRNDRPFLRRAEESRVDQLSEKAHTELDALLSSIVNTLELIDRCAKRLSAESNTALGQDLVTNGTFDDVRIAIETTNSELLVLSGVCEDAVIHEELRSELGAAVERRSQILDLYFLRRLNRPLLARLSSDEQLRLGTRILREMALAADATNPANGLAVACRVIEGGAGTGDIIASLDSAIVRSLPDGVSITLKALLPPSNHGTSSRHHSY